MHWQLACFKSNVKAAYRFATGGRLVIRDVTGEGRVTLRPHGSVMVKTSQEEMDGFDDWHPFDIETRKE